MVGFPSLRRIKLLVKSLIYSLRKQMVVRASNEKKINYLRNLGVKIGQNCEIWSLDFSTEPYLIELGDHVAVSSDVSFVTHDEAGPWCFSDELTGVIYGRIIVGNNVFIGHRSTILANTQIGENCIIGAGSVVRGKYPANSVLLGNPAQVVSGVKAPFLFTKNFPGYLEIDNLNYDQIKEKLLERFEME